MLKPNELMLLLQETYYITPEPKNEVLGFILDMSLSKPTKLQGLITCLVYVRDKHVVMAIRGTKNHAGAATSQDWGYNFVLANSLDMYKQTDRYKLAETCLQNLLKKYPISRYKVDIVGHSQSGMIVHLLSESYNVTNAISVNPAYKNITMNENEYLIRSSADVISALAIPKKMPTDLLYPNWSKRHIITIPAETSDLLEEHKTTILNRLEPNMQIGKGLHPIKGKALRGYIINTEF